MCLVLYRTTPALGQESHLFSTSKMTQQIIFRGGKKEGQTSFLKEYFQGLPHCAPVTDVSIGDAELLPHRDIQTSLHGQY